MGIAITLLYYWYLRDIFICLYVLLGYYSLLVSIHFFLYSYYELTKKVHNYPLTIRNY